LQAEGEYHNQRDELALHERKDNLRGAPEQTVRIDRLREMARTFRRSLAAVTP